MPCAFPSTALTQSQAMQLDVEKTVSRFPQVAFVFSKTGTPEMATDPMPPNASDTFIILKPREEWPDPSLTKDDADRADRDEAVNQLPGNAYEFTQPIQMRFNELIAGVRGDIAVKVFGDEFEPMLRAANQIAAILRGDRAAPPTSRSSRSAGLPVLEIKLDKADIARRGLSLSAVQDVIGAAVGGRRRAWCSRATGSFEIVVRLPESVRARYRGAEESAGVAAEGDAGATVQTVPLRPASRNFNFAEGPNQISRENGKRRVVVTANVRGRDIGSVVDEARKRRSREQVKLPAGYWIDWGGQFENLAAARAAPHDRGAGLLRADLPAAVERARLRARCAAGVQRGAARADRRRRWRCGCAACRSRSRPPSASSPCPGVAVLNGLVMLSFIQPVTRQRHARWRRQSRRRADAAAARRHDGAGGLARLRADGACNRHRRRGAEAVGDRGHRRPDQRHAADAAGAARIA